MRRSVLSATPPYMILLSILLGIFCLILDLFAGSGLPGRLNPHVLLMALWPLLFGIFYHRKNERVIFVLSFLFASLIIVYWSSRLIFAANTAVRFPSFDFKSLALLASCSFLAFYSIAHVAPTRVYARLDPEPISAAQVAMIGLSFLLVFVIVCNAWVCDDAYITFRTVDNFVHGYGLRWNISERVQSFTHPLWMLLLSAAYFFSREVFITSILISILLSLLSACLLAKRVACSHTTAIAAIVLLLSSKAFIDFSTSGLENPLTYFCLALFFVFYFQWDHMSAIRIFWFGFLASLGIMNRYDTALIYVPALVFSLTKNKSWKECGALCLGFLPLLGWELFSIIYYGFLLPNTAYAKLNTGIDQLVLIKQGFTYFFLTLKTDPITLLAIFFAAAIAFVERDRKNIAVMIGVLAYLLYTLKIGGDFMAGRFFSAPFFCAVAVISRSNIVRKASSYPAFLCAALSIAIASSAAQPPSMDSLNPDGIIDEKRYYYEHLGLLSRERPDPFAPNHPWIQEGEALRKGGYQGAVKNREGMIGFYAGPTVHIIDTMALTDALLSRLPTESKTEWRIGHFKRIIPDGYLDTIKTGKNLIKDEDLAAYYDHLSLITSGNLLSKTRLVTIIKMNLGYYDDLIDREKYQRP